MNKLWIVVKEVYRKNVLSWSFFFMVIGPILMIGAIAGVTYFISQDQLVSRSGELAVISETDELEQLLVEGAPSNNYRFDLTEEEAQQAMEQKEVDGYLVINGTDEQLSGTYYRQPTSKDIDLTLIQQLLANYQLNRLALNMGLDAQQLAQIQASTVDLETVLIQTQADGEVTQTSAADPTVVVRQGVAYAVCFIVFLFIMTYVSIISQEIAAEKGSRIMEIILSSVTATTHFFGKMIGIGLVILTQLAAYVLLFFIGKGILTQVGGLSFLDDLDIGNYIAASGNVLSLGVIYALVGILIYTSIAGFLGSLVSTTEDVNKMVTPIVLFALVGYYIGMYANVSTNNLIVRIGSQIPLFTPFVMPMRIAAETVSNGEIVLSVLISIIFMVLCLYVSSIFYKSNVLIYSDKGLINTFKRSLNLWQSERKSKKYIKTK